MVAGHLRQGQAGEDAAVQLLKEKGFQILERNWRCQSGEVDVICQDRDTVVFVEVRTRGACPRTSPAQSVNRSKITKLTRAASYYLSRRDWWERPCRFDVVAVIHTAQGHRLEHIPDAFSFPQTLGRGRNPWQPW
ncbi:putative endonuclease [Desulfonatronum zhilinae]|nr:putative endonuclease [Desulfonatronum zhilinae]